MAYNQILAERIRRLLSWRSGFSEKAMFGGIGFFLNGNMAVGVWKESLVARVGPERYQEALRQPQVKEFDITGRRMNGWVLVAPEGVEDGEQLRAWIEQAIAFVETLPAK